MLHAEWSKRVLGRTGSEDVSIIRRKSLTSMTPAEFASRHDNILATPALLTDVWGHGTTGREEWCQAVVEQLSDAEVEVQLQMKHESALFLGKFEEFLDACYESTHTRDF